MDKFLGRYHKRPFVVAGPCSAESQDQAMEVASGLHDRGVHLFRAGLWKPRTRPGSFSGVGDAGLEWLTNIRTELGMKVSTEVAHPEHLDKVLKAGVDVVWIGARTTANPFSVQQLADALKGVDIPVLVKNPINPDLSLWIGAVERLQLAGIEDIGLIHRGFSFFNSGKYRNSPLWQIAIEMHTAFPEYMMLCDVSHICGVRELLPDVAQSAMDLAYDGLMVEAHPDPNNALSDSAQQITLDGFDRLMSGLVIRNSILSNLGEKQEMRALREKIDALDDELVTLLGKRMQLTQLIGEIKEQFGISVFQPKRWAQILERARQNAEAQELGLDFIEELFKAVHQESINHQLMVMNSKVAITED